MGRLTEFFDYIDKEKEVTSEYDRLNYNNITITDELKKFRKKIWSEKIDRDNKN